MSLENNSVCKNQDKFNTAFQKAVDYTAKKQQTPLWAQIMAFIILVIIFGWAIMLASEKNEESDKTLHYILAILFSPVYIIAYYIDSIKKLN